MYKNQRRIDIGQRIRTIRLQKHMTQAYFAESLDISINFLSELENGKKGLSEETIYKICQFCNISADYLLYGKNGTLSSQDIIKLSESLDKEELDVIINYLTSLKNMRDIL